jgi:hypothetical protein
MGMLAEKVTKVERRKLSSRRMFRSVFVAGVLAAAGVQAMAGGHPSVRRPAWTHFADKLVANLSATARENDFAVGLIQPTDLRYMGSFRLPNGVPDNDSHTFDYGGSCMAYNPSGNGGAGSLLICGHQLYRNMAEVTVPELTQSVTVPALGTAQLLQNFTDVLLGHADDVSPGTTSNYIGGAMVVDGRLVVSVYVNYDANLLAKRSHFLVGADLGNPQFIGGPYEIGTLGAGWVAGSMATVPPPFQSVLGGTYLTGQCCLNIISRTSAGPAASSFNVADLQVKNPAPAKQLLGYPMTNPTLGGITNQQCSSSDPHLFDCTASMGGMVFPTNSRSVLFFGRLGTGQYCYGPGTADPQKSGQPDGEGGTFCYDPSGAAKGGHAYPYVYKVWAYDANDLAQVKAGTKRPWDIVPYSTWDLTFPVSHSEDRKIMSVAYDAANQRIFVATAYGEGARPLIHVLSVGAPSTNGLCR